MVINNHAHRSHSRFGLESQTQRRRRNLPRSGSPSLIRLSETNTSRLHRQCTLHRAETRGDIGVPNCEASRFGNRFRDSVDHIVDDGVRRQTVQPCVDHFCSSGECCFSKSNFARRRIEFHCRAERPGWTSGYRVGLHKRRVYPGTANIRCGSSTGTRRSLPCPVVDLRVRVAGSRHV